VDIDSLINRVSAPAGAIGNEAPGPEELHLILAAGMAAPDHGGLTPWRLITIQGEAIGKLGDVFAQGLLTVSPEADDAAVEKMRRRPRRAPLILAVVFSPKPSDSVSQKDQLLSAGAVAHQLVLAAESLGYGSVWLTGPMAGNPHVTEQLSVSSDEELVAFVYIGKVSDDAMAAKRKATSRPAVTDHVTDWAG